ncbi:MAG: hypothetical protein FWD31_06140 [Planctomycetaceae bacterium]|nr:hypothetical protein [Planctomycetaceae bacterium]
MTAQPPGLSLLGSLVMPPESFVGKVVRSQRDRPILFSRRVVELLKFDGLAPIFRILKILSGYFA